MSVYVTGWANYDNSGYVFNFTAAYNYLRFKFQRQDQLFSSVSNVGGYAEVTFGVAPPAELTVGSTVYINGTVYNAPAKVTAISGTDVTLDIDYIDNDTGFVNFNSIYKNWRLEVIIDVWDGSAYVPINGQSVLSESPICQFRSLPNGDIIAEVQEFLKDFESGYFYNAVDKTWEDNTGVIRYQIRYRENYEGITPGAYTTIIDQYGDDADFFSIKAAKQIGEQGGPALYKNTAAYFVDSEQKLFATLFEKPTYFIGWPFDLSIYVRLSPSNTNGYVQRWYDINGVQIDSDSSSSIPYPGKLMRVGVNRSLVTSQPYSFTSIELRKRFIDGGELITEIKMIKVATPCNNPIGMVWRNSLGGWDYWVFERKAYVNRTVSNGDTFEPYIEDMATANTKQVILSKEAYDVLTVGSGGLDQNDVDGLMGLPTASEAYVINQSGVVQYRVNVQPGTWLISETNRGVYELEFSLIKPSLYTVSN